jgi:RHS repeat-associated protein
VSVRHAHGRSSSLRRWALLVPAAVAAVLAGGLVAPQPAVAAPASGTSAPQISYPKTPDVTSPVASDAGAARAAAEKPAPAFTPTVQPKSADPVTAAREQAAETGKPVEVAGQTSETSILYAQPDGSLRREVSAGPVRVQQNGAWVPIDTDLVLDKASGTLHPAAVVGDRAISAGGNGPLATVGAEGTSLSFSWPTTLPTPQVSGDTATYRDVLDGVDLVVAATSVGFSERLVVNKPLADPAKLSAIALTVSSQGATVATGQSGSLVATATTGASKGEAVVSAGAPLMWDASGTGTDGAGADRATVPAQLTTAPTSSGSSGGSLVLTPDLAFLTDPATVYPVTIDPAPSLTELGDTFISNLTPDDPRVGATSLAVGSPDTSEVDRSLLRFDISPVAGYHPAVLGASLDVWNSYTVTCAPTTTSVHRVADFDPATVTWNTAPDDLGWVTGSSTSLGFDASCPAGSIDFDVTSAVTSAADGGDTVLALQLGSVEGDPGQYKTFNSGSADDHLPTLTVTYASNCDLVDGYYVCDEIRDAFNAEGGEAVVGSPTNHTAGTHPKTGSYQTFTTDNYDSVIFWSPATGAHRVWGYHLNKYESLGAENSWLGFPTTDEYTAANGSLYIQDFEHGSIYWSADTDAHAVRGDFVAHYRSIGAQDGYLGAPTSDTYAYGSGQVTDFIGGYIVWDQQSNTFQHFADYPSLGGQAGWATQLDYQLSDTVDAKVNAGTGNLNVSIAGLTVPGVGQDRSVGFAYNSFAAWGSGDSAGSSLVGADFRLTDAPDTRLIAYPDQSVRYIDPSGRVLLYRWTGSAYEAPIGDGGTKLERDGSNNWVLTTLASNRKQTFRAADGLEISDADRNGNTTTFAYNNDGVPTSITGTRGGAPITFTVTDGYLTSMQQTIDGTTRKISFTYDDDNVRLTAITDASGKTTSFDWSGDDLTTITDPRGIATAFQYDDVHRVVQVVRDYGNQNLITGLKWDTENRNGITVAVTRVTDPNNGVTNYSVDAFVKVTDVTDPLGHKKATTYSPNNDVATAVDAMPAANTTTYSYNGADGGFTPTGVTSPTGAKSTASYPSTGTGPQRYEPTSTTDAQNNTTTIAYDAAGNPTQQVTGGVTTTTTYNPPAGQPTICAGGGKPGQPCTSTDGRGNTTTYTYDTSGNLTTVTPPAGVIKPTSYTYDGAGRPKTMTDGNNKVTTYVYDKNDRVTQVRYNGATSCSTAANCEVYTYDADGNLTKRVDAAGTTTYAYNSRNVLAAETTAGTSGGGAQSSTLTYDLAGNLVAFGDPSGTTRYGYDAGDNLVWLAEPGGSCTGTVSKCTRYSYDGNDARTQIAYPGGTTVNYLNIDASGRPTEYKATNASGTVLMDFKYSFTGGNGDTSLVQTRSDLTVSGTAVQTYTYDAFNRLSRALEKVGSNTTASWTYCYDPNGNRTYDSTSTAANVLCPGQAGGPTATYTYDATDALTGRSGQAATAFSYDGNGAELAAVGGKTRTNETWNAVGQLTGLTVAGTAHTYAYAGQGNKERLVADSSAYQNTALGVTTQTGTGSNTVIREPNGTAVALVAGGASNYFVADRQGSTIALVSSTGTQRDKYSYDPYGVSRSKTETVVNPWQYTGGELDNTTGLYHLEARYYDPTIGRFTQADPSGQEMNNYAYASENPTNLSDPHGTQAKGGKQNVRDSGLADKTDAQIQEAYKNASGAEKARLNRELKARGLKHRGPNISEFAVGGAVLAGGAGLAWWAGKLASPLCGPAVLVCAVVL